MTDIAAALGTKLPTVVRTLAKLRALGLILQKERGLVRISAKGRKLASQLLHRHNDIVRFLSEVLGVPGETAEADGRVVEHGFSGESAERLHYFLVEWESGKHPGNALPHKNGGESPFSLIDEAAGEGKRA